MKYKNDIDFTYMGNLHNAYYTNELTDEQEIANLLKQFNQYPVSFSAFMPTFFALDYSKKEYLFMTDSVKMLSGHHPKEVLEGGLDWLINDIWQRNFFNIFNTKIFPAFVNFFKTVPQTEHHKYVFSYNNRMKCRNGSWVDILQKASYITSEETGLPLYCLGMFVNISAIKKDNLMVHTIEKIDHPISINNRTIKTDYFYPYEEDALLSRQEKNVLGCMADGLSSKMIAHKLKISENTVSNHRQNMLRKSNTKNVAELVAFAVRNRII